MDHERKIKGGKLANSGRQITNLPPLILHRIEQLSLLEIRKSSTAGGQVRVPPARQRRLG
jgi:hypothetical protein